ncbi:septum site-determining protein MinC [Pusillimonas sp. CC-YST705]|uniref:Probable septum site-determining protein MinC n=1 Tax=Mesopusillimonas faecipullorum TaxID=2755040 RepID=A0ABS8C9H3_9BURK|nr:septum site-determining protein MinC [Mesopusillimonas faecipullorum]MCB5362492.1 septum site-determining protein MinC [Mesopusillimonas faecipullorum]
MSQASPTKPALDFKSAALYAVRVVLHSADSQALFSALDQRMQDAGSFFEGEPIVVDASQLDELVDWSSLLQALRGHGLHPIGIVAQGDNLTAAQAQGLAAVDLSSPPARPASTPAPESEVPAVSAVASAQAAEPQAAQTDSPAIAPAAMVVNRQLRSGQRLYARHTDLIVIGVVGQGAEVIADGNIHVYGPLRGKAMAGARGDTSARIFSTEFNPELVAVAGVYRVLDNQLEPALHRKPCVVQLESETLRITPLGDKS